MWNSTGKVLVRGGSAYVPHTDLVSILASRFRSYLSQKLAVAYKSLPYVARDERIAPLMKKMQLVSAGSEYGATKKLDKPVRPCIQTPTATPTTLVRPCIVTLPTVMKH